MPNTSALLRAPPTCRRVRHAGRRAGAGPHRFLHAQRAAAVRGGHAGGVGAGGGCLLGHPLLCSLLCHLCRRRARLVFQPGGWVVGGWVAYCRLQAPCATRQHAARQPPSDPAPLIAAPSPVLSPPVPPPAPCTAQAPSNAVCMWSVPTGLRPFAMSISVVVTHLLGDVPSPPLLGSLQGRLHDWRVT